MMKSSLNAKSRIKWIDIAKGITIILMIIGHTVPNGSAKDIIYSFHMPLFIILSGYTFNYENDDCEFCTKIIRDIKRLLLPTLVTVVISIFVVFIQSNFDFAKLLFSVKQNLEALFWASAISEKYADLGLIWFLVTLFWIRLIVRVFLQKISFRNTIIVISFLGVLGLKLGKNKCQLPQNFDVVLVGLLFFAIGLLWKRYDCHIRNNKIKILLFSIWVICIGNIGGINIDMGIRQYPGELACIIQAIAGTFVMCNLANGVNKLGNISKFLSFIGKETLLILCIHHIEFNYFDFLYDSLGLIEECIVKCIIILGVLLIIKGIKNLAYKLRLMGE